MDFLIWIIILLVINGVAGGKKKKPEQRRQPPAAPPTVTQERRPSNERSTAAGTGTGLGTMVRDLVQDIQVVLGDGQNSRNQRRTSQAERSGRNEGARPARQPHRELTPIEQECDYCTGQNSLGEPLKSAHVGNSEIKPIVPIVFTKTADAGCVDVGAIRRELKLSDAQNALLWREILDKPLALRHKN